MEQVIFYIISGVILVFALLSVTSLRILRSAVYLLFVLGSTAGIYFMLGYLFLGAVQLLVYVGGVVVLIIFAILLTSHINEKMPGIETPKALATVLLSISGALLIVYLIIPYPFEPSSASADPASVSSIGQRLMSYQEGGYVLPFEVISILLLAAMIAAIVIAKRTKKDDDDD